MILLLIAYLMMVDDGRCTPTSNAGAGRPDGAGASVSGAGVRASPCREGLHNAQYVSESSYCFNT